MSQLPVDKGGLPTLCPINISGPYLSVLTVASSSRAFFGARAATICAWYAIASRLSGREHDYRLWLAAFKHLQCRNIDHRI